MANLEKKQVAPATQIKREGDKITVSLTYDVVESSAIYFEGEEPLHSEDFDFLRKALSKRIEHCKNILTKDILPAEDKVFTEHMIFSNKTKKHFSLPAMEVMENVYGYLITAEHITVDYFNDFTLLDLQQCIKAVGMCEPLFKYEEESKERLMNCLTEWFLVKSKEDKA